MVEMIEPHDGTVFDPACGSGGMFVQSARFVEQHRARINGNSGLDMSDFYVSGMEKTLETVKLAKMNIFVNGLRGEIKQANTYYEDPFQSYEKFDYVLANPPFNVDDVALDRVENDARFNTYGVPRNKTKNKKKGEEKVPNANYLWINLFATSLKPTGRAGLVMANSASDARHSEADIRKSLIEHNLIYAMITLPSNMFYTVTLPATLWFFDKAREDEKILFIDARNIFTQIDRAHREFSEEQIQNIAIISRLHKNKSDEFIQLIHDYFEKGIHRLISYRKNLKEVSEKVTAFLKTHNGDDIPDFNEVIDDSKTLVTAHEKYQKSLDLTDVDKTNKEQQKLNESVAPFFEKLHEFLKLVDKKVRAIEKQESAKPKDTRTVNEKELKILKNNLDELHREVKEAEYFFSHITWLQERFPEARYEDVTGLCKLATHEEVKEQDYSLNPGRYVGVVIEEDGKTEEEFIADMADIHEELKSLNAEARKLETVIDANMRQIVGE